MRLGMRKLTRYFSPSKENAYRPYLMTRQWLLLFLVLAMAAEGFLMTNLVVRQTSENFLAAVFLVPTAVAGSTVPNFGTVTDSMPYTAVQVLLAVIFILVMGVWISTLVIHFDIQPTHLLAEGLLVAMVPLLLLLANGHFLGESSSSIASIHDFLPRGY